MVAFTGWPLELKTLEVIKGEIITICTRSPQWMEIVKKSPDQLFLNTDTWKLFLEIILRRGYRQQPLLDLLSFIQNNTLQGFIHTKPTPYTTIIKEYIAKQIKERYKEEVDLNRIIIKAYPGDSYSNAYESTNTPETWEIRAHLAFHYWIK